MGTAHFPLFAILLVPILLIVVALVNSHISGWASLAQRYRDEGYSGDRLRFRSAAMRYWGHYGNCLTMGANPQGFFLAMSIPIFPGFPPLFIPWSEITVRGGRFLWSKYVELRLGREPAVPFRIRERLARSLAVLAGGAWPKESATDVR